jgi:hypothetical protein
LQVTAVNPFKPDQIQRSKAKVGIIEEGNPLFSNDSFYDGLFGSTLLDSTGKIGGEAGSFLRLKKGTTKFELKSVANTRYDTTPNREPVFPNPQVSGDAYYSGAFSSKIRAIPAKQSDPLSPLPGDVFDVAHWVDEREYERRRIDKNKSWSAIDAPNNTRDWLEKKTWDKYSDFPNESSGELDLACSLVDSLREDNLTWASAYVNHIRNPTEVVIRVTQDIFRHPFPEYPPMGGYYWGFYRLINGLNLFDATVLHEARHVWQFNLSAQGGVDSDGDLLYVPGTIPATSSELLDAPNIDAPGGANSDGHFQGDGAKDRFPAMGEIEAVHAMLERNALRFISRLGLYQTLECALHGFFPVSDFELSGPPLQVLPEYLTVEVEQDSNGGIGEPAPGVTVRFSVEDECDAMVDGSAVAWAVTDSMGEASVEVTVGSKDCEIVAEVLPPAVAPTLCLNLAGPLTFNVRIE